jgi:hypothetical protein
MSQTAFPTSASNNATGAGSTPWTNVANVLLNTSGTYATFVSAAGATPTGSEYAVCTGFGFSIPSSATITGIGCNVIAGNASSGGGVIVNHLKIVKAGTISGTDIGTSTSYFNTPPAAIAFGGSTNLWGNALAYSDVNNSGFGVAVAIETSEATTAELQGISLTVFYYTASVTAYAGTVANVTDGSDTAWTNPTHAQGAPDGSYATCALNKTSSDYLEATNFGFSLAGYQINGVQLTIEGEGASGMIDATVSLIVGGTITGSNYDAAPVSTTGGGLYTSSEGSATYGSAGGGDQWGVTGLTGSQVSASNFGAVFQVMDGAGSGTSSIDSFLITIYYAPAVGGSSGWPPVALYGAGVNVPLALYGSALPQPITPIF